MNVYGQLIRAQLHLSASDLTPTATGLLYFNTSTGPTWYNGSAWRTAADLSSSQVFTNKDYDGGTASNTSRITLPKASTVTLTALTRKAGNIFWDTTQSAAVVDTGAALVALSTAGTSQDSITNANNYSIATSVAGNALTIALKTKAGSDPSGGDTVNISFRSTTATDGTYSLVSCSTATSVTISSGSTLGHRDGIENTIYVYALNNSGTIELVASTILFDDGTLQSTTAEGGAGAADSYNVLYSTTARTSKAIRLIGRLKSTQTTAGTWAAVPTETTIGTKVFNLPTSQVRLDTGNGHGSTSTKVRRFTNRTVTGTAITANSGAGGGDTLIINEHGIYSMSYADKGTPTAMSFGIALNATGTTDIASLTPTNRLIMATHRAANTLSTCSATVRLAPGDVITPQTDGSPDGTGDQIQFIITQLVRL